MTEIEKIERAIISVDDRLKKAIWRLETLQGNDETIAKKQRAVENLTTCLTALTEKLHRLQNPPLTLQQLKDRVGKPVWTVTVGLSGSGRWEILDDINSEFIRMCNVCDLIYDSEIDLYGKTWLAYRYEPT